MMLSRNSWSRNVNVPRHHARRSQDYTTILADDRESQRLPTWNTYLYRLQQEAPKPFCVACQREVPGRPEFYGNEFHGTISRIEADSLLREDGYYLVRKSERAPDAFTLAIRFNGETKNFKLYYDGKHYVGEKRFDTVYDLVADGLIHFYIELRAADYIKELSNESNYEESPYMAYNQCRLRHEMTMRIRAADANRRRLVNVNDSTVGECSDSLDGEGTFPGEGGETGRHVAWNQYEKPHVFKVQNFVGLNWCDYCANFMWGLLAQGVKCQGLDAEGLYRLAGFHDDVEAIRIAFDKDGENTDIGVNKYEDINTIASALKLYFRLLPIPLITFEVYKPLLDAIKRDNILDTERVKQVKDILTTLPPAHYHTIKYLTGHLIKVMEHKSKNMMSAENLSIVFAPTLMRPLETDPMVSLMSAKFEQKAMEFILIHQRDIFGR
ncbi:hypothetical protein C0Q70_03037 [Pomacea canaliculata]|uniref:Rho-GAP domain-containing protein n=1 Tax=Pomacea canaliculata TaxID=400727 RepID=A0A2T7PRR5_POMCA|nr:hypothetical protein C0Q70_03037 [Pomacea canaliculata]